MTAPREGAFDRWEPTSASTRLSEERWPLPAELAEAVAERDRARSCAVALEQENARLTAEVTEAKVSAREWERDYRMSRRDALRATVAAVRALCDEADEAFRDGPLWSLATVRVNALRAALAVPADTPTEEWQ